MAKLTLNTIGSRYGSIDALNDNFNAIEAAIENTLSRDGTSPNALNTALDMNGNPILNASTISASSLILGGQTLEPGDAVSAATVQVFEFTATAGQTSFSVSPLTPTASNLLMEVNGLSLPTSSLVTSGSTLSFPALTLGDEAVVKVFTRDIGGLSALITNSNVATNAAIASSKLAFTQAGTGALARTVQDKLLESICVFDFMTAAQIADVRANTASLDVSSAVTSAIVASVGKSLYFPAGTYSIRTSLELNSVRSNMRLYGEGAGTVLKLDTGATDAVLMLRQASNIDIEYMKIDGNGTLMTHANSRCVRLDRAATNIKFNNVWFYNGYEDNVACFYTNTFGPVNTVNFTDCKFDTTVKSTSHNLRLWRTENITVQGCYFTNWVDDAIQVNFGSPPQVSVIGGLVVDSCYFQNVNSDLFAIEMIAGDISNDDHFYRIKNVVISNNIFDANNKATLGASGISGWADNVSITGNTWRRSNSGTWRQGIEAAGNYWTISSNVLDDSSIVVSAANDTASNPISGYGYVVTGNSVTVNGGSTKYAIFAGGSGRFDGLIISNNRLSLFGLTGPNSGAMILGTYGATGIVKNAKITNNLLSHDTVVAAVDGIQFSGLVGSENIDISQNTLLNFTEGVSTAASSTASDVTINSNIFRGCTTNISLLGTVTARVAGNTYSSAFAYVSADRGDASVTIVPGVDASTQVFNTPLSTNRTITLSTTNAFTGATFKVVRQAAATGASTLSVGGLKTLAVGQWAIIEYGNGAWFLSSFGSL